jgi:SAM-dependent methyltransferase
MAKFPNLAEASFLRLIILKYTKAQSGLISAMAGLNSMKGLWWRIPVSMRLLCVCGLFVTSIIKLVKSNQLWLLWAICVSILWIIGAVRIRLKYMLYVILPFVTLFYICLALLIFHIPIREASGFWAHYPSYMMFLLAVLLAITGILLEEWVIIVRRIPPIGQFLCALCITMSTAFCSTAAAISRNVDAFRRAKPNQWFELENGKARSGLIAQSLDRFEISMLVMVDFVYDIVDVFTHWWNRNRSPLRQESNMRLDQVYSIPFIPEICEHVFGNKPICPEWKSTLGRLLFEADHSERLADIGSGSGRVALWLAAQGWHVDAVESQPYFSALCRRLVNASQLSGSVNVIEGTFPVQEMRSNYRAVICHQNVMLELINELGLEKSVAALARILAPNGILVFDYPIKPHVPTEGSVATLFEGRLPCDVNVRYEYIYEGMQDIKHRAKLRLTSCSPSCDGWQVNVRQIGIVTPHPADIKSAVENNALRIISTSPCSAFSFFPAEQAIWATVKEAC